MRNAMAMVLGILLAVAFGLSGCKIVSATPDTKETIDIRTGQTFEFKVSGITNTTLAKYVWETAEMNTFIYPFYNVWPNYRTVLDGSDTFKLTINPNGAGSNRIKVRCVVYKFYWVPYSPSQTGRCGNIGGCLDWWPSDSSKVWDIRVLQDTAPVWQGNYHIRDRRDIELLEDYTTVSNCLYIDGNDFENLEGCENLLSVENILVISHNKSLKNLSGLQNITSAGGLYIFDNDALTSLSSLQGLTSVNDITISDNDSLTNLSGFENITSVDNLALYGNNALTSLSGLKNITSIGGDLNIEVNNSLTSLSGLENLTSIDGALTISYNDALISLGGMSGLQRVDDMFIELNGGLTALEMTGLQRVDGYFEIDHNYSLCTSLAEELLNQVLARGGHGGYKWIEGNKNCTTP